MDLMPIIVYLVKMDTIIFKNNVYLYVLNPITKQLFQDNLPVIKYVNLVIHRVVLVMVLLQINVLLVMAQDF